MTANKNTIKVFLIEQQKIVRQGIKVLLEEEPDLQVFTSQNKDVKISLLNHLKPDILFVSLDNLDENDFSYLNIFHELNNDSFQFSRLKIIIYANQVNQYILARSLQLGCDGYLLKESSIEELKQAIRSVYNGYKHIGNSVFGEIVKLTDNRLVETDNNFINSENNYAGLSVSDGDLLSFEDFGVLEPEINKNFSSQNKTFHEKNVSEAVAFSPTENNDKKELLLKPSSNNLAVKLRQTGFKVLLIGIGYVTATSAILFLGDRLTESKSGLTIEGKGGIPPEPGLPLDSRNIFVNGQTNPQSTIPAPIETAQGKIQPARGVIVTESGEIILTAYRTNNRGERIPEIKPNCS